MGDDGDHARMVKARGHAESFATIVALLVAFEAAGVQCVLVDLFAVMYFRFFMGNFSPPQRAKSIKDFLAVLMEWSKRRGVRLILVMDGARDKNKIKHSKKMGDELYAPARRVPATQLSSECARTS
jgi:hypothetical protein